MAESWHNQLRNPCDSIGKDSRKVLIVTTRHYNQPDQFSGLELAKCHDTGLLRISISMVSLLSVAPVSSKLTALSPTEEMAEDSEEEGMSEEDAGAHSYPQPSLRELAKINCCAS
jgi:hypothetical protein